MCSIYVRTAIADNNQLIDILNMAWSTLDLHSFHIYSCAIVLHKTVNTTMNDKENQSKIA